MRWTLSLMVRLILIIVFIISFDYGWLIFSCLYLIWVGLKLEENKNEHKFIIKNDFIQLSNRELLEKTKQDPDNIEYQTATDIKYKKMPIYLTNFQVLFMSSYVESMIHEYYISQQKDKHNCTKSMKEKGEL